MEQKNKGGRPTKAEVAARGITKTELEAGIKILKKIFGSALDTMIELSDDTSLSTKDRFKLKQDLVMMYINLIKSDQSLKQQLAKGTDEQDEQADKPLAPVFNFAK
ncbi:hypothetical protein PHB09_025 [Pseudomonas phage PHB09]|uniref:Uncharacterized protein n=1 Tax=Pseudomonas phage PHB09 TaxID=2867265 RepID=A0AAE8XCR2_9CAUD|nr:hypothetical protein QGX10_gp025 [Pseudomonas phage PHB09]UAV84521.1 hypothetical protein PHB09_025 [Pseudomonas phage PHB09]